MKNKLALTIIVIMVTTSFYNQAADLPEKKILQIELTNKTVVTGQILKQDSITVIIIDSQGTIMKLDRSKIWEYSESPDSIAIKGLDSNKIYKLSFYDGTTIIGKIILENDSIFKLATPSGIEMDTQKSQVENIVSFRGEIVDGKFQRYDPNRTRLFLNNTGRPLDAGEGYISLYELSFPYFAIGLSDRFSISAGMILLPGSQDQLYANVKFTPIVSEGLYFSTGAAIIGMIDEFDAELFYGTVTLGNNQNGFTGGIFFGMIDGEFTEIPGILLGCDISIGESVKLISENYVNNKSLLISLGLRFFGDNWSGDFGLMTLKEDSEGFSLFPWLGITYNFGGK